MGLSTSQLRSAWAPACNSGGFVTVELFGDGRVTVDPRTVEAVLRLDDILEAWSYQTRREDTGAYNCRQITGGSDYSLHAYGIALDINWQSNPYGPNLITDMPRGMVDDIIGLRTNNGKRVWEWGGDWSNNKDAMHYEIDCAPADLATGIVGGVSTPAPPPQQSPTGADMFVVINSVACLAIVNNVMFQFKDWDSYLQSYNASPNVPVIVIGDDESMDARRHFYNQLFAQHVAAVTVPE